MVQTQGNLSNFNRRGEDKMALGHTPSTRSAELVAGARAALHNTEETAALSKMSGRVVARILSDMDRKSNVLWFFPARMMAIELLTKRHLPKDKPGRLLVDVAAGFSPRGLHMARNYPQAEVVEIDLPEVVAEKRKRLERGGIPIPDNLSWVEADLGKSHLSDILGGRKADLITSEGLSLYLSKEENMRFFQQACASLKLDGVFMVEMYFQDKLTLLRRNPNVNAVASFIFRIVGSVPGLMANAAAGKQLMSEAGLDTVIDYPLVDLMDQIGQPRPLDVISIMTARKPTARSERYRTREMSAVDFQSR